MLNPPASGNALADLFQSPQQAQPRPIGPPQQGFRTPTPVMPRRAAMGQQGMAPRPAAPGGDYASLLPPPQPVLTTAQPQSQPQPGLMGLMEPPMGVPSMQPPFRPQPQPGQFQAPSTGVAAQLGPPQIAPQPQINGVGMGAPPMYPAPSANWWDQA